MRVQCVIHTLDGARSRGLDMNQLADWFHYDPTYSFLKPGQEHAVYALLLTTEGIWVFILEDDDDEYPKSYPLSFFDIIEDSLPAHWVTGKGEEFASASRNVFAFLAPREWTTDRLFYEHLIDGEPQAVATFKNMYPHP